jgi:hypothetical protein
VDLEAVRFRRLFQQCQRFREGVRACCDILDLPRQTVQSFFNAAFLTAYAFPVVGEDAPVRPSPADGLVNLWRQLRIRWSA